MVAAPTTLSGVGGKSRGARTVLIISPRFPPANAADSHRVRLSVKHYQKFGWRPIVLCSEEPPSAADDWRLYYDIADQVEIVRVKPWSNSVCSKLGFNQIDLRAFFPMLIAGAKLIKGRGVLVAFFSSTAFTIFLLGPIWKVLWKVRLIYDMQDTWCHGKELPYGPSNAPGSWKKYQLMQILARIFEPIVMRNADHIISVSDGYIDNLASKYQIPRERFTLLPFPGAVEDFILAQDVRHKIFDRFDGKIHWVYAGRGGPDLNPAIKAFFKALKEVLSKRPSLREKLMIHFVGTNYAPDNLTFKVIEPVAAAEEVQDIVQEHSSRVRYLEVIDLYSSSDLILLFGSTKAEYTASKLVNCLMAGTSLLAIFHEGSVVQAIIEEFPSIHSCFYSGNDMSKAHFKIVEQIENALDAPGFTPPRALEPWLASQNAKVQCEVFDKVLFGDT